MLKADLWIWHAFFGVPGSNNDLNVLNQSTLFTNILQGQAPRVQFTVNGTQYNNGYYLADCIYPERGPFVKTVPLPQGEKRKLFARRQETVRKDVIGALITRKLLSPELKSNEFSRILIISRVFLMDFQVYMGFTSVWGLNMEKYANRSQNGAKTKKRSVKNIFDNSARREVHFARRAEWEV